MEPRVTPPDSASARQTEMGEKFNRVLFATLDALEERNIAFALIGGIAASGLGRPRSTHDIDIFVRPEDADAALDALTVKGFDTERRDPRWLYKAWKEDMMVDIIFKSSGDIYFDNEMHQHAKRIPYHGRNIPVVAPEDLIIIKAAVHSEVGPHHWHDALAILSHATVDWAYLVRRSRRASRRLLALLIYAQGNDILIPNHVIIELYNTIFGHEKKASAVSAYAPVAAPQVPAAGSAASLKQDPHLVGHIQEALAADDRTAALDLHIAVGATSVMVKGEVTAEDHRPAIDEVIRRIAPGYQVENRVVITAMDDPQIEEVV
jgi:predicted nucleotidyltransferase